MREALERALGIPELRSRFFVYTREAWRRTPAPGHPRVLDVGCGQGASAFELVEIADVEIVGIDVDEDALRAFEDAIERRGLGDRLRVEHGAFLENAFADGDFDVLWAEGVLHLLDVGAAFGECRRLLGPGGHLVVCETLTWLAGVADLIRRVGFEEVDRVTWTSGCWWSEYYAPLEARIRAAKERGTRAGLERYVREVEMVRADPARFDCAHVILRRSRTPRSRAS